jgi:hypothetical protein
VDFGPTRGKSFKRPILAARSTNVRCLVIAVVNRLGFGPPIQNEARGRIFDWTSGLEKPHDLTEWRPWVQSTQINARVRGDVASARRISQDDTDPIEYEEHSSDCSFTMSWVFSAAADVICSLSSVRLRGFRWIL